MTIGIALGMAINQQGQNRTVGAMLSFKTTQAYSLRQQKPSGAESKRKWEDVRECLVNARVRDSEVQA